MYPILEWPPERFVYFEDRKISFFHLLVHSSNAHNSQVWVQAKYKSQQLYLGLACDTQGFKYLGYALPAASWLTNDQEARTERGART